MSATYRPSFFDLDQIAVSDPDGETAALLADLSDLADLDRAYSESGIELARRLLALHGLDSDREDDALFLIDEVTA